MKYPVPRRGNLRKTYWINPRFQTYLILQMIVAAAVVIAIFYAANSYVFYVYTAKGEALGLPVDHVFFQFLADQRATVNLASAIAATVVFIGLALRGMFLSHKIAGPLYRLDRHMQDVATGKTSAEVRFRKGDFFPELASSYNKQLRRRGPDVPESSSDSE